MKYFEKLKEKWSGLTDKEKKKYIKIAIVVGVILLIVVAQ
jgi:hypothetical protein